MTGPLQNFFRIGFFPLVIYTTNDLICRFWINWYASNHVDNFFHFIGGMSIAYGVSNILSIFEARDYLKIKRKLIKAFFVVSVVSLVAVLWELYEFLWDFYFQTSYQPNTADTIKDLVVGTCGGATLFLLNYLWSKTADRARKWNAFTNMFRSRNPAHNSLKSNTKTRVRN